MPQVAPCSAFSLSDVPENSVALGPPSPEPRPARGWQGHGLVPALLIGLAGLVWVVTAPDPAPARVAVSAAAFGAAGPAWVPIPAPVNDPVANLPALIAMDAAQAARFLTGLARFDEASLIAYAAATEADLGGRAGPMDDDLRDAQALIRHELARRGNRGS